MSEPRWSIQAPREEGAPFLLCGGVMVGRLYGGAPVSEMLRLLNAEDADTLRQARVLAAMILATRHTRWWIGSDRWAQYKNDLRDLLEILAEPLPDTGANP